MNAPQDDLQQALALHRSGQLAAAIASYRSVLARAPANANLLYLLGTALLQSGQLREGSDCLERSLALHPANAPALNNLGIALKDLKRPEDALGCFDKAIALQPDDVDAHNNRAAILNALGRPAEAVTAFDKVIALRPGHEGAHVHRGRVLRGLGRPLEALDSFDRALSLAPARPDLHVERAVTLRDLRRFDEALAGIERALATRHDDAVLLTYRGSLLGELKRFDEAVASFERALASAPEQAHTHNECGLTLKTAGRHDEALAHFERAIRLAPDFVDALNNLGNLHFALGRLDEARRCFEQALARDPANALSHSNLGAVHLALGEHDQAAARFDRAIALSPDDATGHWYKAALLILQGDYLAGWALYEQRLNKRDFRHTYPRFDKLAWRGQESIAGRRLFIHAEQGLGDVIQFCRYLPLVSLLGADIVFEVPAPLVSLVSTLRCEMTVIAKGVPRPEFDAYCPVMSLPFVFRTTPQTIPARAPYLFADAAKVAHWQKALGTKTRPRVGLVWSGSPTHQNDLNRSVRLDALRPLLDLPVEWHSLQKELRADDAAQLAREPRIRLHGDELRDFSDTAALADCMDLVISVDTSVAHLAGAIGRPVWILLPRAPDYRWMLDRADSPWYPTARLFRQSRRGDWTDVIEAIRASLLEFVERA
jgi:tetratricopeptide (TPR) repeat protein